MLSSRVTWRRAAHTYSKEGIVSQSESVLTSIDLSAAPDVLFLFGLAGAGKNFVGDLFGTYSGRHVYHADTDIPKSMQDAIAERRTFTEQMRDEFFEVIRRKMATLQSEHPQLIVTQAAYKQRHRDFITQHIAGVQFIHVTANDELILKRLNRRGDWISPEYASQMRAQFEAPSSQCPEIANNGTSAEILLQVEQLFHGLGGKVVLQLTNSD